MYPILLNKNSQNLHHKLTKVKMASLHQADSARLTNTSVLAQGGALSYGGVTAIYKQPVGRGSIFHKMIYFWYAASKSTKSKQSIKHNFLPFLQRRRVYMLLIDFLTEVARVKGFMSLDSARRGEKLSVCVGTCVLVCVYLYVCVRMCVYVCV